MKIFIDHQIFSMQEYGGISRYFCELLKHFEPMSDIEASLPLLFSNNHYLSSLQFSKHSKFFPNTNFIKKNYIQFGLNHLYTAYQAQKNDFDIAHPTYYFPNSLSAIKDKPYVLTVHDMTHEKYPDFFKKNDKTAQRKRHLVEGASKIIAISEHTKQDLIEVMSVPEEKIEVIYHGSPTPVTKQVNLNESHQGKYILFVGQRGGYKNYNSFIRAIAPILADDNNLKIICAGGGMFSSYETDLHNSLGISHQVMQQSVSDERLADLYCNAVCFVFPSLYEGFGMPVLESFSYNCPLICSNASSLPEVAGDGAVYFDPHSENDMQNSIQKILENRTLSEKLIKQGKKRLNFFSWEQTADQTKNVYKSIL